MCSEDLAIPVPPAGHSGSAMATTPAGPRSTRIEGNSINRTIVVSIRMAAASPMPICYISTMLCAAK